MFSQYFGNYLLNKGIITLEQLKDVMAIQKSVHVRIGILAVNSGYLNADQIAEIHMLQTKMDKKFGEIAVEKGYLTVSQLESLLTEQQHAHLMLGQALMDRNYMTLNQVETALNNYKKENNLSDEQLQAIQKGDVDGIISTFINFKGIRDANTFKGLISLFARNLIRFIDADIRIEKLDLDGKYSANYLVTQKIVGENSFTTGMDMQGEALLKFVSKYVGEEIDEVDQLATESYGEFLNVTNGIFTVNMSNQGVELDLEPQIYHEFGEEIDVSKAVGVAFCLPYGEINLIIFGN